jgi:protein-tyrosine phosphatase
MTVDASSTDDLRRTDASGGPSVPTAILPTATEPDRVLALPGALNLRDVGGYPAADGRRVRRRVLLRSAAMHGLGDQARAVLAQLGVHTVVDLREDAEAAHEPNALGRLPITTRRVPIFGTGTALPVLPADQDAKADAADQGAGADPETRPGDAKPGKDSESDPDTTPGSGETVAAGARAAQAAGGAGKPLAYIYDLILDTRGDRLTAAVLALAEPGALPAIVHCSAGKDRTGLTIMMVLDLLGVPDEVIAADYSLTAELLGEEALAALRRLTAATTPGGPATLPPDLLACPPELILAALARVRANHGSARGYLRAHGATDEALDALTEALLV